MERTQFFISKFNRLEAAVQPLERFIQLFTASLEAPELVMEGEQRGYRFKQPGVKHFCLLKLVRAVSALNAAIWLGRAGFTQEIAVLMRTMVECTSDIDFVLPVSDRAPELVARASKYVQDYFADDDRTDASKYKRVKVNRRTVHRAIGADLDKVAPDALKAVGYQQLLDNVYQNTSGYVHANYPEAMDLYGGTPGKFHPDGMAGTPKDLENVEVIETYSVSVKNAVRSIIIHLRLYDLIQNDPDLKKWYYAQFAEDEMQ